MVTGIVPEVQDVTGRGWSGRRVTVAGLGKSGRAAAELLRRAGCRLSVTDASDSAALRRAADELSARGIEAVELGQHSERLIARSDLLVVSPGIAESSPSVQSAIAHRVPIISEIELAFRFCPSPVIAVTGTNGKSSVVTLIEATLRASGRSAIACGNLGVPFSAVVGRLTSDATAIVEVSSFQLAWCDTFRPKIGVLLNLGTNHLDRHGDRENYIRAKAGLFRHQTPEDWAVLNGQDPEIVALDGAVTAQRIWFGENRTNPSWARLADSTLAALSGNAQAVLQVGRLLDVPEPLICQVMRSVRGLEHRMEHVVTCRGVNFINDSKSTTPDSLLFALRQLMGSVVLIIGGRDKGLDFRSLADACREERIKGAVLIGESRQRLRPLLGHLEKIQERETLEEAVQEAAGLAAPGDTVLFSPACASFDMFENFEARGRAFKTIVHTMNELDKVSDIFCAPARGRGKGA